jgi:hypothetical protein
LGFIASTISPNTSCLQGSNSGVSILEMTGVQNNVN